MTEIFSVIVPVYNHQNYVLSALLSAAQSPLVGEVLVVDDSSTDRSPAIIGELARLHAKITVLPSPLGENRGAHARLNQLANAAANRWIAVLNSDDEFVAGRFEAIEHMVRRGSADFFFGDLSLIDELGEPFGRRRAISDNEFPWPKGFDAAAAAEEGRWLELLLQQNIVATSTNMVFSRELFRAAGGFRAYRYCHDWDFALRILLVGGTAAYAPLMMSRYRLHPRNTIKDDRHKVRAEIRAMLENLLSDFPDLTRQVPLAAALRANRTLNPLSAPWLQIVRSSGPGALTEAELPANDLGWSFVDAPSGKPDELFYIYAPGEDAIALSENDLRNLRLAVSMRSYDMLLVSRTLEPAPAAGARTARSLIVYRRDWKGSTKAVARARLMRLMPEREAPVALEELIGPLELDLDSAFIDSTDLGADWAPALPLPPSAFGPRPSKPVVFVMPAFLALGGAERLAVLTMKHLAAKYYFVVIATEPLLAHQGSMASDALQFAEMYDLAETVRQEDRLAALHLLTQYYAPQLVWVCNGSPWQIKHAKELRALFAAVPMVDNRAYDHEEGWIGTLSDAAVRSSDRYIAINRRILAAMTDRYDVDPSRIDLIYHGAEISHLRDMALNEAASDPLLRQRLGLPATGLIFGMIGRLSAQKRPQDLVRLAARMRERGADWHFLWAGPGEMRSEIAALCSELNATNFFLLPATDDVSAIYRILSGLIITSTFEGLPVVMLEALALGVPILSTPVGAIEEVLTAYGCGRISGPPGDVDALEREFLAFVDALPALREAAVMRRGDFADQFSAERMARQYDESWTRAMAEFQPHV